MNNKLLVGGIFYDLENAFDCVNHYTLLSTLKILWDQWQRTYTVSILSGQQIL